MRNPPKNLIDVRGIVEVFAERALGTVGVAVLCTDSGGLVTFLNVEAETMTGWSSSQAVGRHLSEVFKLERRRRDSTKQIFSNRHKADSRVLEKPSGIEESHMFHRSGRRIPVRHGRMYLWDDDGNKTGQVVVFKKESGQYLVGQSTQQELGRDHVTGLLNRQAFTGHLQRELKKCAQGNRNSTLFHINLDQFRLINDTCGHNVGDALLQWVSALLREVTSGSDVLSRLGGDEFGLLLKDLSSKDAKQVAKNIRDKLRKFAFSWEDRLFTIGLRIGIIPLNEVVGSVENLLFAADHASFQAGQVGGDQIYVYNRADEAILQRQKDMDCAAAIKRNLSTGRFELFGQPIRPLSYEPIDRLHFEVLLRPKLENGSLVSPVDVIRAAEEFGGMELLDRWVIRNTLQILKNKSPHLANRLGLCSINLSGASLKSEGLLEYIHEQIADSNVPPAKVCFEITETAAVGDLSKARWLIEGVSAIGCRFALDDFGTGMASYGYLRDLPVDFLKIDGIFITDMVSNKLNRTIVDSINQISHFLGISTIAEFVGSHNVFRELKDMGVDFAQGYWTGKPMPLTELFKPNSVPPLPLPPKNGS